MAESIADNAVDDVRIAYGHLWERADAARISAQAWADKHAADAGLLSGAARAEKEALSRRFDRMAAEWAALQLLIARVAASKTINDELARIAAAERAHAAAVAQGAGDA